MPLPDYLQSNTARVNGVRLHYLRATSPKPADRPPLLLLHGWPATCQEWLRAIPLFMEQGYADILAPDLRGLGEIERPAACYDKATVAADVHALLEHLGLPRVLLVGHDVGAMVAYALAAGWPRAVERLVFSESVLPGYGLEEMMDVARGGLWHFGFHMQPDLPETVPAGREREYLGWFYRLAYHPDAIPADRVGKYVRRYSEPGGLKAGFEHYRAMLADGRENRARVARQGKLLVPMLVINGAASLGEKGVDGLRAAAAHVESLVLDRCGHWTPSEQPEAFTRAVDRFFRAGQP